jgi:hypothetical protein
MGLSYVSIPLAGRHPPEVESLVLGGERGAAARFAAVGASEEYYELALRQQTEGSDAFRERLTVGVVNEREGSLEIGWSDAAGLCSTLAEYGAHLVEIAAQVQSLLSGVRPPRPGLGFAEIRGRLATRAKDGFDLQVLRGGDPPKLALTDATGAERAIWEALATRCMCPVCPHYAWTVEEGEALAARFARGEAKASELGRAMVRSETFFRIAIGAAAHPYATGKQRASIWGSRPPPEAVAAARGLVGAKSAAVRAAAYDALVAAAHSAPDEARSLVSAALADGPKTAIIALRRARGLSPAIRASLIDPVLAGIGTTKNVELVTQALILVIETSTDLDADRRAALAPVVERVRGHATGGAYVSELAAKLRL